ncbi:GntR family transcriptional regulator [Aureimonas sp. Leaf460]|nr:GntR family transcriptional regulator [Aureimonas sp. Leaf427]KQT74843.1 GntR family transcriptional regulator [Aureimonas sp. Leaf460]
METEEPLADGPLSEIVASQIRDLLITGHFRPGERLSEQKIAAQFGISRNTLREVFRLLTSQRLLVHVPHRGVFVRAPDEASVIDIYRVRSVIQQGAIGAASRHHPALGRMRHLVGKAEEARDVSDWQEVGTINMTYHRAMVEFCDSSRLSACFELVLAELRLVFGQFPDTAHLHEPFIETNAKLVELIEAEQIADASRLMESYLRRSERLVIAALQRSRR